MPSEVNAPAICNLVSLPIGRMVVPPALAVVGGGWRPLVTGGVLLRPRSVCQVTGPESGGFFGLLLRYMMNSRCS